MATACARTITLLYIYLCVWGLDLKLNNINYSYWYFPSFIIITSLYWTSETPLSSSITTSEYLICDRLKTKKGKPCSHTFKCSNCKSNHQADSNECPFWQHRFNKEWYSKEYSKIHKSCKQSIHSSVDGNKSWLSRILKSFHRMFGKTIWLLTQFWKQNLSLISYLFKNLLRQLFAQYQV